MPIGPDNAIIAVLNTVNILPTEPSIGINLPATVMIDPNELANTPITTNKGPMAAIIPANTTMVFCIAGDKLLNQSANLFINAITLSNAGCKLSYIDIAASSNADFISFNRPCKLSLITFAISSADPAELLTASDKLL